MTAATIGVRNHAVLHDFEIAHQRFTRLGIEPHKARRMAWYAALRLTQKFSDHEAWEATDAILGPQINPSGEHGGRDIPSGLGASQALPGGSTQVET